MLCYDVDESLYISKKYLSNSSTEFISKTSSASSLQNMKIVHLIIILIELINIT